MRPGDVVQCGSCATTAVAYTTGDPARWKEGGALMVSWHGYRHEAGATLPGVCLFCQDGTRPRPAPNRRAAICDELARAGVRLEGAEWRTDAELEEAFQRWIAAGRPSLVLVSVGVGSSTLAAVGSPPPTRAEVELPLERSPEADDALARFERDAAEFLRETGLLAPGKQPPVPEWDQPSIETREAAWIEWLRKRKASAPRPPPKPPKGTQLGLFGGGA